MKRIFVFLSILLLACAGFLTAANAAACKHHWLNAPGSKTSCTEDVSVEQVCTKCGATQRVTKKATGHNFVQHAATSPTCNEAGVITMRCTNCGWTYYETGAPATGEHYWKVAGERDSTCKSQGYTAYECKVCGFEKKVDKPLATDHRWESGEKVKETCTTNGGDEEICFDCGKTRLINIKPATGHDLRMINEVKPTCTKDGAFIFACRTCGAEEKEPIRATGHDYEESKRVEPTCTKEGSRQVKCKKCGHSTTETLPAAGHKWKDTGVTREPTCSQTGLMGTKCRVCGKESTRKIDALPHSFGNWMITKQATEKNDGTRKRTCQICGFAETASYSYAETAIQIFTTASKVNLRQDAGSGKKLVNTVAKKNTCLGILLNAKADSKGTVWFQVRYKNKLCWVTSEFARAEIGLIDPSIPRFPEKSGKELRHYFLKSFESAVDALKLTETAYSDAEISEWGNDAVFVSGEHYIEQIVLHGEGYTLYGVKVGDKIKEALKTLKGENLVLDSESADEYVYRVPCLTDALEVDDEGFCAYLSVIVDQNNTVQEIHLYSFSNTFYWSSL